MVGRVKINSQRLLRWSLGLALYSCCVTAAAQASEAGLRVAFVYNFLKFIEWADLPGGHLSLCAVGAQDVTRQTLAQLDNKVQQSRHIRVIYMDTVTDVAANITSCQLVYVPESGAQILLPESLPAGILLIKDEANLIDTRVGISLLRTTDNRIEFVMSEAAIAHAGVKVSSQLLKLAKKRPAGGA